MNTHYDKYLVRKYEPLYRDRYGNMQTTAMCWGFEVGDGWFDIINILSQKLCAGWLNAKEDYDYIKDREGEQIYSDNMLKNNPVITKEMIAERKSIMDEEAKKVPIATQVKEKFGGLRFYIDGGTDEHYAYISFAESMSRRTCEICGDKGKPIGGYWISTRCEKHADT